MGGGFSLRGSGFCGFPSLDIRQLPACAAGRQTDRFGESRVSLEPAARGQVMDTVARADLPVCEIGGWHCDTLQLIALE